MNVDQLFDNALAVADRIAGRTEMDGFLDFSVDMTESFAEVEPGICLAAMCRESGQKVAERQLWSVGPVSPDRAATIEANERATRLAAAAAAYAADPNHETDVDLYTFAEGLAKAYRHHTGETPTFLLDDDGEF